MSCRAVTAKKTAAAALRLHCFPQKKRNQGRRSSAPGFASAGNDKQNKLAVQLARRVAVAVLPFPSQRHPTTLPRPKLGPRKLISVTATSVGDVPRPGEEGETTERERAREEEVEDERRRRERK